VAVLFALIAVAVIGVAAVAAAGKLGQLADPVRDRPRPPQPQPPLSAATITELRFGTALRGYRMDDVDQTLAALHETLRIREAQLAAMSVGASELSSDPTPEPATLPSQESEL